MQVQTKLPMDMPMPRAPVVPEEQMRALFCGEWCRWHRARTYEEAVADPRTAQLLALTVLYRKRLAERGMYQGHQRGRR